jgi:hypothetical protein
VFVSKASSNKEGPDTKEKKPGPLVMRGTLHRRALRLGIRKRMVRKPLQSLGEGFHKPPRQDRLWCNRPAFARFSPPSV